MSDPSASSQSHGRKRPRPIAWTLPVAAAAAGHLRRAGAVAVGLMAACLFVAACSAPGQPQAQPSSSPSTSSGLAYAQCMRSHGVPDFPDPTSNGAVNVKPGTGIDPQSPQFQAADRACKSLLPHGRGGPTEQDQAQMLKFSQCMREHGVSNFPDPDSHGALGVQPGMGIDPQSPQFQAAQEACKQYRPKMGSGDSNA